MGKRRGSDWTHDARRARIGHRHAHWLRLRAALDGARHTAEAILTEAELLPLSMRVGGSPGRVATRLQEIAARSRAGLVDLWARQAVAARDEDGASLEAIARGYERIGARIADECGARGLLLVTATRVTGLTARERETAQLAAHGLSNAEIAARLSLSVRTVESHIYRATTKLGLHDRAELAALLARRR